MKGNSLLDRVIRRNDLAGDALTVEGLAHHASRRDLCQCQAGGLGNVGHGARSARIDFQNEHHIVLDGELHVHQAHHLKRFRHGHGLPAHLVLQLFRQAVRRQGAGGIA